MRTIFLILIVMVVFVLLDLLWFKMTGNFLKNQIYSIARLTKDGEWSIRMIPIILVYFFMALGVVLFVLPISSSTLHALCLGVLFGIISYGIYDMTNLGTLSAWTLRFALIDMLWGTCLCGVASSIAYTLSKTSFFS